MILETALREDDKPNSEMEVIQRPFDQSANAFLHATRIQLLLEAHFTHLMRLPDATILVTQLQMTNLSPTVESIFFGNQEAKDDEITQILTQYPLLQKLETILSSSLANLDVGIHSMREIRQLERNRQKSLKDMQAAPVEQKIAYFRHLLLEIDFTRLITPDTFAAFENQLMDLLMQVTRYINDPKVQAVVEGDPQILVQLVTRANYYANRCSEAANSQIHHRQHLEAVPSSIISDPVRYIDDLLYFLRSRDRALIKPENMPGLEPKRGQEIVFTLERLAFSDPSSDIRNLVSQLPNLGLALAYLLFESQKAGSPFTHRSEHLRKIVRAALRLPVEAEQVGNRSESRETTFDLVVDYYLNAIIPNDTTIFSGAELGDAEELLAQLKKYVRENTPLHTVDVRVLRSHLLTFAYLVRSGKLEKMYQQRIASHPSEAELPKEDVVTELLWRFYQRVTISSREFLLGKEPYLATVGLEGEIKLPFERSYLQSFTAGYLLKLLKKSTKVSDELLEEVVNELQDKVKLRPDHRLLLRGLVERIQEDPHGRDKEVETLTLILQFYAAPWEALAQEQGSKRLHELVLARPMLLQSSAGLGPFDFQRSGEDIGYVEFVSAPTVDPYLLDRDVFSLMMSSGGEYLAGTIYHLTAADIELSFSQAQITDFLPIAGACCWDRTPLKGIADKDIDATVDLFFGLEMPEEGALSKERFEKPTLATENELYYIPHHQRRIARKLWDYNAPVLKGGVEVRSFHTGETVAQHPLGMLRTKTLFSYHAQGVKSEQLIQAGRGNEFSKQLAAAYAQYIDEWKNLLEACAIAYPQPHERFVRVDQDKKTGKLSARNPDDKRVYLTYLYRSQARGQVDAHFRNRARRMVHSYNQKVRVTLNDYYQFLSGSALMK